MYAIEEFFPGSGIVDDEGGVRDLDTMEKIPKPSHSRTTSHGSDGGNRLRRMDTGISSIVGSQNGERPGGFVLVIDGPALSVVRALIQKFVR